MQKQNTQATRTETRTTPSPSIAALITNYNTWPDTVRCARELVKHGGSHFDRLLIVDDASDDPPPDELTDRAEVIRNEQNLGYVASINSGFAHLEEDLVVVLDSDAYPLVNPVPPLIEAFADDPDLGALGFRLVDRQGAPTGSCSPEPTVHGLLLGKKLTGMVQRAGLTGRAQAGGLCLYSCGMAVRREAFERIGGFDEGFDFLDADNDFSMRLRQAGWKIDTTTQVTAFHEGEGSSQSTARRVIRHHRNRWRLLEKHGRIRYPRLLLAGLIVRHFLEYGLLRVAGRQLFPDRAVREDKLKSRRQLLSEVWTAYGNGF